MNWEQVEGKWKQLRGGVKEKWGKLINGCVPKIQRWQAPAISMPDTQGPIELGR